MVHIIIMMCIPQRQCHTYLTALLESPLLSALKIYESQNQGQDLTKSLKAVRI